MSTLALGFMDDTSGLDWFELEGAGMLPGMLGCSYQMQIGSGEKVSESAVISLRGSRNELQAVVDRVETLRSTAAREPGYCLRIWSETQGCFLMSPLAGFRWRGLPSHLPSADGGSFSLELSWERDAFFYGEELPVPLSNTSASGITSGLTLYNHDDAHVGHDNWFEINTQSIGNLWQLPLRLEIKNTTTGEPLADFWLGSMSLPGSGTMPALSFEAENGSGGSSVADAGASGGKYCRYDWTGSGWQTLANWTVPTLDLSRLQGFTLLPLLRFFGTPDEANLRLRWQVSVDGAPVWVGPASGVDEGKASLRMEPLSLPWGELPLRGFAKAQQLSLQAFHPDSGAHRLHLDNFLLLPQQTFGAYRAIGKLKQNASLIDDQSRGAVWSESGGQELQTHVRVGAGHYLLPGALQRFYCFLSEENGAAPITRTVSIRGWYRGAWRMP